MTRHRTYTDAELEQVRELGKSHTVREVSEIMGISIRVLRNWKRTRGFDYVYQNYCHPGQQGRIADIQQAEQLIADGNDARRVGLMLGRNTSTIRNWCTRYGWEEPPIDKAVHNTDCEKCDHSERHLCCSDWCGCEVNRDVAVPEQVTDSKNEGRYVLDIEGMAMLGVRSGRLMLGISRP